MNAEDEDERARDALAVGIRRDRPTELAAKPNSSVKTMVNPRTNRRIGTTSRRRSEERAPDTNAT
jgi:hypothetical protein